MNHSIQSSIGRRPVLSQTAGGCRRCILVHFGLLPNEEWIVDYTRIVACCSLCSPLSLQKNQPWGLQARSIHSSTRKLHNHNNEYITTLRVHRYPLFFSLYRLFFGTLSSSLQIFGLTFPQKIKFESSYLSQDFIYCDLQHWVQISRYPF